MACQVVRNHVNEMSEIRESAFQREYGREYVFARAVQGQWHGTLPTADLGQADLGQMEERAAAVLLAEQEASDGGLKAEDAALCAAVLIPRVREGLTPWEPWFRESTHKARRLLETGKGHEEVVQKLVADNMEAPRVNVQPLTADGLLPPVLPENLLRAFRSLSRDEIDEWAYAGGPTITQDEAFVRRSMWSEHRRNSDGSFE